MKSVTMQSPWILLLLCVLGPGSTVNGSNCPPGAMNIAQNCIKNSVPSLLPTERSVDAEIEVWRRVCLDSSLNKASECLRHVMDNCTGFTDEEQNLQRLFSHQNIQKTAVFFCNNFQMYENNIRCVHNQHEAASKCSRPQMESFRRKIAAKSPIEVMILSSCRSHQVMTDCLLEPVYTECGESAAMFLEEITTNSRPPVCQKLPRKYLLQQSDNNGANSFAVTSLATWCSLLFWMLVLIKPSLKL